MSALKDRSPSACYKFMLSLTFQITAVKFNYRFVSRSAPKLQLSTYDNYFKTIYH
ncbi:hypothetical protein [Chamaesiphon sp.]|uniref:hypothetical protein n=1 Tax=Chamaesiphon sp. TaxID=2814140 RepID=UPI0035931719